MDDFKSYILSSRIANEKNAAFYVYWVSEFYRYCSKDPGDAVTQEVVEKYLAYLASVHPETPDFRRLGEKRIPL